MACPLSDDPQGSERLAPSDMKRHEHNLRQREVLRNPVVVALRVNSQGGCVPIQRDTARREVPRCRRALELGQKASQMMPPEHLLRTVRLQETKPRGYASRQLHREFDEFRQHFGRVVVHLLGKFEQCGLFLRGVNGGRGTSGQVVGIDG